MVANKLFYVIPSFLLLASATIAVWTGYVVYDNHDRATFEDSPNYIPVINFLVGCMSVLIFLANVIRVCGCMRCNGCCDSGLSCSSFLIMFALIVALFIQIGTLTKAEREFYENELERYYELTIGQSVYFIIYLLMVFFQYMCHTCDCCLSCIIRDEDDANETKTMFV